MRKLVSISIVLALVLAFIPSAVALAAESGTFNGSFSVGGAAPSISALEVYSDAGLTTVAGSLTPQVLYYVKVTTSDPNTLNDVKEVKLKVYYDAAATHPDESTITTGHEQTTGIYTWTKAGDTWAVDAGGGTSWAVVSASSVTPTMTASTGDWVFAIKLGKVATETSTPSVWDIYASVTDNSDLTAGHYLTDKLVMWYGEVQVTTPNVDFGEVALGSGFGTDVNKVTGIGAKFISNGDFASNVRSSATWTGSSNNATLDPTGLCLNANEFAIKAYGSDTYGSAILIDTVGVNLRYGTQTLETGLDVTTGTAWLKIASVFPTDSYSGTFYFVIVNN